MRFHLGFCLVLGALAAAGATWTAWNTGAAAQSDSIQMRQGIMASFGKAVKEPGSMLRHEAPFDLAVVRASFKTIAEGAPKLKALFPEEAKTAQFTDALPTIWQTKDDFLRIIDQLTAAAEAAGPAVKDDATFRTEWGKVSANCRACHKVYRALPKN